MSAANQHKCPPPPPAPKKFDWAAASDDDDEDDNTSIDGSPAVRSPTKANEQFGLTEETSDARRAYGQQILLNTSSATATPSRRALQFNDDDDEAVGEGSAKRRQCQEVMIQAAIPYTLKSVWNGSTRNNNNKPVTAAADLSGNVCAAPQTVVPAAPTACKENSPAIVAADSTPSASTPTPSSSSVCLSAHTFAIDELIAVLRANNGALSYQELMRLSQWRTRFYRRCHSLFNFLKLYKSVFSYKKDTVSLVQEGCVVSELIKMSVLRV